MKFYYFTHPLYSEKDLPVILSENKFSEYCVYCKMDYKWWVGLTTDRIKFIKKLIDTKERRCEIRKLEVNKSTIEEIERLKIIVGQRNYFYTN
jgi:hypothetical protein